MRRGRFGGREGSGWLDGWETGLGGSTWGRGRKVFYGWGSGRSRSRSSQKRGGCGACSCFSRLGSIPVMTVCFGSSDQHLARKLIPPHEYIQRSPAISTSLLSPSPVEYANSSAFASCSGGTSFSAVLVGRVSRVLSEMDGKCEDG